VICFLALGVNLGFAQEVYVLKSAGICQGCAEAVSKMLISGGLRSQILGSENLKATLKSGDLLVVGGSEPDGEGEWALKQDLIRVGAFDWLKQWISRGGRYLGICAGAYLAEAWIDPKAGERGLDLFPGRIESYSKRDQAAFYLRVQVFGARALPRTDERRWVYFQDGPGFSIARGASVQVFARFEKDGSPAALSFSHGKGRVGLISPHFEADESWQDGARAKDRDRRDYDLGVRFVRELLEQ
jgi:hypothetical protein